MYKGKEGGRWKMRGMVGTDGTTYGNAALYDAAEITAMLANGVVEKPADPVVVPDPVKQFAKAITNRLRYVEEAAKYNLVQPITVQVTGQDKVFPMDADTVAWRHGANSRAGNGRTFGPGDYHKTVDRERIPLNNALVKKLADATFDAIDTMQKTADDLADTLLGMTPSGDLAADLLLIEAVVWPWPGGVDPRQP